MMYRNFFICLFLVFTFGCSDSNNDNGFDLSPVDPPATPIQPANVSPPEWLYVQTAETAQMTSDTTLKMPFTRDVFAFTDRPDREHAYFTAFEFASFWTEEGGNSFSEDPPNAVLTWVVGEEQFEAEVIIKNATVYADGAQESLVYEVTLETEQMPDAQMSSVSLFVDNASYATPWCDWPDKMVYKKLENTLYYDTYPSGCRPTNKGKVEKVILDRCINENWNIGGSTCSCNNLTWKSGQFMREQYLATIACGFAGPLSEPLYIYVKADTQYRPIRCEGFMANGDQDLVIACIP